MKKSRPALRAPPVDPLVQRRLNSAVFRGDLNEAKAALELGADPNVSCPNGARSGLLINAVLDGRESVVELLLAGGSNPNERSEHGDTALLIAMERADDLGARLAALLFSRGADPHKKGRSDTPLGYACQRGRLKALKALIKAGYNPTVEAGVSWVQGSLMEEAVRLDRQGNSRLLETVRGAQAEMEREAIEAGLEPRSKEARADSEGELGEPEASARPGPRL